MACTRAATRWLRRATAAGAAFAAALLAWTTFRRADGQGAVTAGQRNPLCTGSTPAGECSRSQKIVNY